MTTIEQRLERLERSQKRYRVATMGLLCLVVAGVTMGQTKGVEDIVCRSLKVVSVDGKTIADMGELRDGYGIVSTYSPSGKNLVVLSAGDDGGFVSTYSPSGKALVRLGAGDDGGFVSTFSSSGKDLVRLAETGNGGGVAVYNKTGDGIIILQADANGNGEVRALNHNGESRTLESK
jgi:transcription elongation GreA/GreB family factor